MTQYISIVFIVFITSFQCYSQVDEIWLDSSSEPLDTFASVKPLTVSEVNNWLVEKQETVNTSLLGGYIQSIFHEAIDSAKIILVVNGVKQDSSLSDEGLFALSRTNKKTLIDLQITHPDYHNLDTSFVYSVARKNAYWLTMKPRYKILLRGRVFAGNMPQKDVGVNIRYGMDTYNLKTRGCFYDKEDYWNCIFDGMFKLQLRAENPKDSIHINLTLDGMKPFYYGMLFNEYRGEIMRLKMKYENLLPHIPMNNINLKLSPPILSFDDDWFVSLSYNRLINNAWLRRLAVGLDASMYMTNVTVTQSTFPGLELTEVDSSYIRAFAGPSVLFWLIPPEQRILSTYAGTTLAFNLNDNSFTPQLYIGTRYFLDLNKAVNLEFRYTEFDMDIAQYIFNPYGNAQREFKNTIFQKLHFNVGIQIAF